MRVAKDKISLEEMGITNIRPRRARTGAFMLEIPGGVEGTAKADALAARLRQELADKKDVLISRPMKMTEMRIKDLEDSVTLAELTTHVATGGGCNPADIRMGQLRRPPKGLGTVWVRCPLYAAIRLTFRSGNGKLPSDGRR
ncbi:PREDICTED: uncharacterized protein LOC108769211 [Trachymyrmex cornetzi]|uniref:uncharacterized protein LOC108769211 n=1 Tax=Trachymyrmex cornetzi TaxID=471704 RepID=UPI00084F272C|nr:PREDICTED: uncharacterized protein LOC108769211 [Trachymyrmex cornetzi]